MGISRFLIAYDSEIGEIVHKSDASLKESMNYESIYESIYEFKV